MKANELRIGNLVKWYDVSKVLELHSEKNKFDNVYIECEESFEWTEYNKLEPIPLTEEWLLKFGFENVHTDWFYKDIVKTNSYQFYFNICLSNGKITLDSGFDENSIIKLKYVHQLQNLYFALTGSELTVA